MSVSLLGLGDVVALKSHPFSEEFSTAVLSGDPQLVSPLMIIVEYIEESKDQFDEKTGALITQKGSRQCKCLWFSTKTYQFEDAWISSRLLKIIVKNDRLLEKEDMLSVSDSSTYQEYFNVSLKTTELELSKRKSSLTSEIGNRIFSRDSKTIINSLVSFVSPVMEVLQIVELKDTEQKEAKFDTRTGRQKRFTSKWAVKCKWFNPISDKMSEKFLPIDALKIIRKPELTVLLRLEKVINDEKYLKLKVGENETIVQPLAIIFKSGEYLLNAYDYKENKLVEVDINAISYDTMETYYWVKAPTFDFLRSGVGGKTIVEEFQECIKHAEEKKALLRIEYINKNGKLSFKTLKSYKIFNFLEGEKSILYLSGYCLSKKEERTFRLDRVQNLAILDLNY